MDALTDAVDVAGKEGVGQLGAALVLRKLVQQGIAATAPHVVLVRHPVDGQFPGKSFRS